MPVSYASLVALGCYRLARCDPFSGIGKPEPLKFGLAGCWSRRIDQANRIVYLINENGLNILSCKDYY